MLVEILTAVEMAVFGLGAFCLLGLAVGALLRYGRLRARAWRLKRRAQP